jgi:hypothetical protein
MTSDLQLAKTQNKPTEITSSFPSVSVYPNPVQNGVLHLYFKNISEGKFYFNITDKQGRIVDARSFELKQGSQEKTFLLNNLSHGLYTLVIKDGKELKKLIDLFLN